MTWVRSQDKKSLQAVVAIWLEPVKTIGGKFKEDDHYLTAEINPSNSVVIGKFSTKAAALSELDAIERWLKDGGEGVWQVRGGDG